MYRVRSTGYAIDDRISIDKFTNDFLVIMNLTIVEIHSDKIVSPVDKLAYIDVLRGIAILMVVVIHTSLAVNGLSTFVGYVDRYGQMGVQLFFVASAYTLCHSFVGRANEPKPLTSFFIRRFFRIAPLYYFAIFIYYLLEPVIHILSLIELPMSEYNFGSIGANILFIHGFIVSANNNIVPGGWSIGTEMAFYTLFPILFALFSWADRQWGILALYGLVGLSVCLNILVQLAIEHFLLVTIVNNGFIYFNLINQLPVFLLGMTIFFHHQKSIPLPCPISVQIACFSAITIIVAIAIQQPQSWILRIIPVGAGISFMLLLNIFKELNYSNSFLEQVGRVSYSMYIFHFMFAWYLVVGMAMLLGKEILPELVLIFSVVLVTGFTYSIAKLSQKYIETPGIQLGKLLISKLESPQL
jgi:peptidoglycan/LPS O-acetylase OafA/YrhL